MTAMRSTPMRNIWLVGAAVAAWAQFVVPLALSAPGQESALLVAVQVLIGGLVVGIGRQGIDVLLLRLFFVSTGLFVGTVLGEVRLGRMTMCSTPLDCVQSGLSGVLGAGLVGTVILALVAIPVTVAWTRGVVGLRPEIRWPVPRTVWQWLLLLVVVAAIVFFSGFILGVPWPA
jgi:hypothetical protein